MNALQGNPLMQTNPLIDFKLRSGIVIATYGSFPSPLTLSQVMALRDQRLEFQEGQVFPLLVIAPRIIRFKKEAVRYFNTAEGMKDITATAIVVNSWAIMRIAKLFQKKNSPIPVKIFFKKTEAVSWLRQQCAMTSIDADPSASKDINEWLKTQEQLPVKPLPKGRKSKGRTASPETKPVQEHSPAPPAKGQPLIPSINGKLQVPPLKGHLLTDREFQIVLILLSEGKSSQEIADQLGVDVRTVDKHRQHINKKTGTKNQISLLRWFLAHIKNTG